VLCRLDLGRRAPDLACRARVDSARRRARVDNARLCGRGLLGRRRLYRRGRGHLVIAILELQAADRVEVCKHGGHVVAYCLCAEDHALERPSRRVRVLAQQLDDVAQDDVGDFLAFRDVDAALGDVDVSSSRVCL
jgi:hypothetical protein